jgi:tRNA (adenine22-N1)-methyltransferase
MTKLSDRLEKIYARIGRGERVADIGTDHALLPIALYERGLTRALILSDIRPGPIEKARANIGRRLPGAALDIRLGGGLEPLECGEADVVVIAGMGGLLIADILSADPGTTRSFGRYILQPRNAADSLRVRLAELGFVIFDEVLAEEGRLICEILCASPGPGQTPAEGCAGADASQAGGAEAILAAGGLSAEISPLLVRKGDPLLPLWIERKIKTEEGILAQLAEAGPGGKARVRESQARIAHLCALLDVLRGDTRDREGE